MPSSTGPQYLARVTTQGERARASVRDSSEAKAHDPHKAGQVRWYVRQVATVAIAAATAFSLILLASQLHRALQSSSVRAGLQLDTVLGLVCLCSASWSLSLRTRGSRALVIVLATIAVVIGVAALLTHLAGVELVSDPSVDLGPPGRMGGNAALLFICLGGGMALGLGQSHRIRTVSDALVLSAATICLFALTSRLFGSRSQFPLATNDPMLLSTAMIGIALSAATVLQRPERGVGQLLGSSASGGVLARRLLPIVIVAPIAITWLTLLGVEFGLFDTAVASALSVVAGIIILVVVLVGTSRAVDRLEAVRHGNEAQIRQMVQDISRHSEDLHRTNRELESFSYSVSHDLRAPIRHIAGFADLLSNHAGARLDARSQKYLATIIDSAQNAGLLIDELLEFSRIGRAALQSRNVDLGEIVRDSWNHLVMERRGRDIRFRMGALPAVHADPILIGVVVANLMSNAVKYTAPRQEAVVEITAKRDGHEVIIEVCDNGVGFDMKYADKLFGVFQRLHGDEFPGTGIGLATVKRIVERHGGRIWADGKLDAGATFHFTLPAAKEQR
jgi:signal transduction histidine kinase